MGKFKDGDKFVIEVEEVPEKEGKVFRIKNMSTIVGESVLEGLDPYIATSTFEDGVQYAQEVYRKLHSLSAFEFNEIFNTDGGSTWSVIQKYSAVRIEKLLKEFVPHIEVGDKFSINTDDSSTDPFIAITYIEKDTDTYYYIHRNGKTGSITGTDNFMKRVRKRVGRPVQGGAYKSAFDFIFDARGDKE